MAIHILGVRHHGVGSAQNVAERIEAIKPDVILVEGPPELESVLKWVGNKDLAPPAAILVYNKEQPLEAVFYPFSEYSPEWRAMKYANVNNIPLKTLDMPVVTSFKIAEEQRALKQQAEQQKNEEDEEENEGEDPNASEVFVSTPEELMPANLTKIYDDPIGYLAEIGGYKDSEAWWDLHFEQNFIKGESASHFEAVMLSMTALRDSVLSPSEESNLQREAYMRQILRSVRNEMYNEIVVVCGAWHAPALLELDKTEKNDAKIIKALPKSKIKIETTWVPWTNERLSMYSGYGAGIVSPGWYEHQWKNPQDKDGKKWLTKVARLFRAEKMDISTAHIIEAVRLADGLAALRGLSKPNLNEFNEAMQTVLCMGDSIQLELVKKEMIVGKKLGKVPTELPKLPLQEDFERQIKGLKLKLETDYKDIVLDLRKENDRDRSIFFHRLVLLEIKFAQSVHKTQKGTFKEGWRTSWSPETMIDIIDKGFWGNTLEEAASRLVLHRAQNSKSVAEVATFIDQAIPAELFAAIEKLLERINELATISADVLELMAAISPLAEVTRYGNVRKTDLSALFSIVEAMIVRVCISLPNACYGLDEVASNNLFGNIGKLNEAIKLLNKPDLLDLWSGTLDKLQDKEGVHPLILGCVTRLLFDAQKNTEEDTANRFRLAVSVGNEPAFTASWVEGFLRGSGMILLYDNTLWNLLFIWLAELDKAAFTEQLPILRRTFSKFDVGERRKLGEKAKMGLMPHAAQNNDLPQKSLDTQRAESILGVLGWLVGV